MEQFLGQYGLLAVYLGMWFEGETVLVIAGFLVHQGMLPRWEVFAVAAAGALSVDHAVYAAGRLSGRAAWLRRLGERAAGSRAAGLGTSWPVFLGIRFVYGTRTPYLLFVGSRGLPWPSFFARELAAVGLWTFAWLFFGHAFGHFMAFLYGKLHAHHMPWIVGALAVSGLCTAAYIHLKKRQKSRAARHGSNGEPASQQPGPP